MLLAAGAAGGMAATFTAPFAGILVAIELLLFEFRARSFIPVAIASAVATTVRVHFVGWAPLFPMPAYELQSVNELWLFAVLGILMGIAGIAMIRVLSWLEETFDHLDRTLPFIKPTAVWAPAIGALLLGVIGYFYPQVFGTGYDTIRDMLNDRLTATQLLGVSFAKFWALVLSLGSGTTGGVFAPSLIVGGGVGSAFATLLRSAQHVIPISDPGLYALVAMAAVFGGIARAPFTAIVFLFELSRNPNSLLPLIVCTIVSDGFVRLFSRESIMTGKLVKRGLIVRQDYSVPVLMRARIEQIMRKNFTPVSADAEVRSVVLEVSPEATGVMPVVRADGTLVGIVEAHDLLKGANGGLRASAVARKDYVLAYPEETVDEVSRDMLRQNVENVVVVERNPQAKPVGVVRAADILRLRRWVIEEESHEAPAASSGLAPAAQTPSG